MYETLRTILVEDLHLDPSAIHPDSSCADAGLDALALVELSIVIQERLDIAVGDDELLATKRVADVVRVLEKRAHS
jgi:acyl carrier protein